MRNDQGRTLGPVAPKDPPSSSEERVKRAASEIADYIADLAPGEILCVERRELSIFDLPGAPVFTVTKKFAR